MIVYSLIISYLTLNRPALDILKWLPLACVNSITLSPKNFSCRVSNCLEGGMNWVPEDGRCFLRLSLFYWGSQQLCYNIHSCRHILLFCVKPGEDVAHCSQFVVDGPCHVLFLRELQQLGINRCISGLCWTREFCAWCCGPPHVCGHILWTYSVADCCRVVYRPRHPGRSKVRLRYRYFKFIKGMLWTPYRLDRRSVTVARTILPSPPSFYQILYKRFDSGSKILTLFLIF